MNSRKLFRPISWGRNFCNVVHMTYMQSDQIHLAKSLSKDMYTNIHVQQ